MPDVPALFNSAYCCAVRMPIPHGVFLSQFTQFRQNRFVHRLEVFGLLFTQFRTENRFTLFLELL
ncbi:hypothetical protein G9X64_00110 [Rhizobium sophorae]|uniref:Uncharacterized protein n=1 Tax=Rhizobium sophorae TaxID=1535242 RepID=A0A7Y3WCL7_9HYPH|nr:hypothetical protein [Rhizobium sophorae]NNU34946.1 hypothetical protein [Rhizobium sophorae]